MNNKDFREVELHYVVEDDREFKFTASAHRIGEALDIKARYCRWSDTYYSENPVVRHRYEYEGDRIHEITVKVQDKGNIVDRFEVNLAQKSHRKAVEIGLNAMYGEPIIEFEKMAYIFDGEGFCVALSQFKGSQDVFLEIEARGDNVSETLLEMVEKKINDAGIKTVLTDKTTLEYAKEVIK